MFKTDKSQFVSWIVILLALVLNIVTYTFSKDVYVLQELVLGTLVLFSFYQILGYFLARKKFLGYLIVIIGVLFITINQTLGLTIYYFYDTPFSYIHAVSFFNTNYNEASEMLSTTPIALILFVFIFVFQYFVVLKSRFIIKKPALKIAFGLLCVLIPASSIFLANVIRKTNIDILPFSFRNTPLYHFRLFAQAYAEFEEMNHIQNSKPNYSSLVTKKDRISTVVLVIGESARRSSMSLYGYDRPTTPYEDAEKNNMLLYSNMVSPAAYTLLSVTMLLSKVKPENYKDSKKLLGDNIVQLANGLNYNTHWLSTQEKGSMFVSTITNIAKCSNSSSWHEGYDEVLIPELEKVLNSNDKDKFIVLHIDGSHQNTNDRYPVDQKYFKAENVFDSYDNSIRYTDFVLNECFNLLREKNAALVYLADHGQKIYKDAYIHSDSKEGAEIPYYIWFGNGVADSNKKIGVESKLLSLECNYYNVAKLLGVENLKFDESQKIKFLKPDFTTVNFEDL